MYPEPDYTAEVRYKDEVLVLGPGDNRRQCHVTFLHWSQLRLIKGAHQHESCDCRDFTLY